MTSTDGLIGARPSLAISGIDRPELAEALLALLVVEDTRGLARCEATFGNWGEAGGRLGYLYFGRDMIDFGAPLVVRLGAAAVFEGRIMAIEGRFPEGRAPEIQVLAEDRFQDLRMTRRTRTFAEMTDAQVVEAIAREHGLVPRVDLGGGVHRSLAQVNQSDLAFLRDRARSIDADLWLDGGTLHAQAVGRRGAEACELTYRGNLREFEVLADLAHQRTNVFVDGWDVAGKRAIRRGADESAIRSELNGDASGASILASALGPREDSLAHPVPWTDAEAQGRADAAFRAAARRFVVGRGVAEADARLRAGRRVLLGGVGPMFNGSYTLSEARLIFDNVSGIRTEFTAERPGIGR